MNVQRELAEVVARMAKIQTYVGEQRSSLTHGADVSSATCRTAEQIGESLLDLHEVTRIADTIEGDLEKIDFLTSVHFFA